MDDALQNRKLTQKKMQLERTKIIQNPAFSLEEKKSKIKGLGTLPVGVTKDFLAQYGVKDVSNLLSELDSLFSEVRRFKTGIIRIKLDIIFGLSEREVGLEKFEALSQALKEALARKEILLKAYQDIVMGKASREEIDLAEHRLRALKALLKTHLPLAKQIAILTDDIDPLAKTIMSLKYASSEVKMDNGEAVLVQQPWTLSQILIPK